MILYRLDRLCCHSDRLEVLGLSGSALRSVYNSIMFTNWMRLAECHRLCHARILGHKEFIYEGCSPGAILENNQTRLNER
jgi:hypothetical protein